MLCWVTGPYDVNALCAASAATPVKLIDITIVDSVRTEATSLTFCVSESALLTVSTKSRAQSAAVLFAGGEVEGDT